VSRDHPALQDLVAALRPFAADPADYDRFTKQWFEDKAMPEYRVSAPAKKKEGADYVVTATVQNRGTGTMPVEIAAVTGERWQEPKPGSETVPTEPDPGYRDARATVTLAAGESKQVTIRCAFDPKQVVVDPDVRVLQLRRKQAVAKL
jgi:hypothetical protein